jgi:[acyl-carrier-protein] S-malonyltransferase
MMACVFSGQGAQKPGMGFDLYESDPAAREIYRIAENVLGRDLLTLDEQQLVQTRFAQPAIVAMSLSVWSAFVRQAPKVSVMAFAGFSLGEYSALGAAGVLEPPDLLALVQERARLMQEVAETINGEMYAVMGLDGSVVSELLEQASFAGKVFAVNFNSPGQTVIAGLADEMPACCRMLRTAGAGKIRKLQVSGAFHTPLMQPAATKLKDFARSLNFRPAKTPLYANNSAEPLPADVDWPEYLAQHICQPVRWSDEVSRLGQDGCDLFLEFGPGKVLTGLIRRILPDVTALPVESKASLDAALSAVADKVRT